MELCYAAVCCGLDVHKKSVTACLRTPGPHGQRLAQMRTFATTTGALLELADWLTVAGCSHVAMESTGIYWRPRISDPRRADGAPTRQRRSCQQGARAQD